MNQIYSQLHALFVILYYTDTMYVLKNSKIMEELWDKRWMVYGYKQIEPTPLYLISFRELSLDYRLYSFIIMFLKSILY